MSHKPSKNQKLKKADQQEWNKLPESLKKRVIESLRQAETGYLINNEEAVQYIRKSTA